MPSSSTLPGIFARLDQASEWLGKSLAWLILIMMLIQFLIVVLRYAFNFNSIPMQESVMYMHASVFMLAAGYTLKHDGHVRVDIFYRGMTARKKALVDLLGTLFLLLPVMVFVILTSLGYVGKSWAILEGSPESGGIPGVFLLKTLIPAFAGLMILQGLVEIARNAMIFTGRLAPTHDDDAEELL
ncbi:MULTISPECIES: TRAP transporter small permease subunit [Halomonadaceae]|jgi:TRAP-type mannitol/chloroaromatic compound transport system permease small subunit|uniref:TRAP transporter small permease subunit n=1 Tax=Halomonadaceae TaxID=28256 RepID=UPI0015828C16|nr:MULTISPECIES: TRAP transporter small permease subunit [Halomonas]MDI4636566.1 TRAP transporter small permease subunit [Halomonas sp. BMC7]NUJ60931.1 TRAP transporter small permease subunit [Halomonas taeanensis]|tara:strand:- start:34817 stop:35371 length:555 start_codon:yes stop_codon:yes gene_type:complete